MPEYIKTNRIGSSLDDAIERTSSENTKIVKYSGGLRVEHIEWNPSTEQMYNPKTDPRYFRKEKIVTRAGEEVLLKDLPPDMLTAGVNPFVQIIYKIVKRGGITSFEDVTRALFNEERVFSSSDENSIEVIEGILRWMNEGSGDEEGGPFYLLLHHGKLKLGFDIPKVYHLVQYKRGYDPFEYHIAHIARNYGLISKQEIYDYVLEHLGWLKSVGKVDMQIQKLIDKKVLEPVQKNYLRFKRPLESYK